MAFIYKKYKESVLIYFVILAIVIFVNFYITMQSAGKNHVQYINIIQYNINIIYQYYSIYITHFYSNSSLSRYLLWQLFSS